MLGLKSKFAVAWLLALSPLALFMPAFRLARMGAYSFSHPLVMVAAFLLFILLEVAALPCFVTSARVAGRVFSAMIGMGLSCILLLLSVALEFYTVSDYWADLKFGM